MKFIIFNWKSYLNFDESNFLTKFISKTKFKNKYNLIVAPSSFSLGCFADDSGLEVDALGGSPGVYSARYAGDKKNNENNIKKIWKELSNKESTKAQFRTVIAAYS